MVFLQFGFAGMFIISVASMKQGMSHYVLVVYRNAVAAAVIAPFALYFERYVRALYIYIYIYMLSLSLSLSVWVGGCVCLFHIY